MKEFGAKKKIPLQNDNNWNLDIFFDYWNLDKFSHIGFEI